MEPQLKFKIGDTVKITKAHTNRENWHALMDTYIGTTFIVNEAFYSSQYETNMYRLKEHSWSYHEESLILIESFIDNTNNTEISTPCKN